MKNYPMQRILRTAMVAVTLLCLGACATAPTMVSTPLPPPQAPLLPVPPSTPPAVAVEELIIAVPMEPAPTPAPPLIASAAPPAYFQSFASYYAKRFAGRRTASGERYDPKLLTAATRDFPMQSWLKVINPANGREVIVRVNDRTGKRKTPLLDLSRAAAKELGFLGKGKIRVHVIPIPPPA